MESFRINGVRSFVVVVAILLAGCSSDQVVSTSRGSPRLGKNSNQLNGDISASVTTFSSNDWITYQSSHIPIQRIVKNGRLQIDSAATKAMLKSLVSVARGQIGQSASRKGLGTKSIGSLASATTDPEQALTDWANANAVTEGPEDDFLATPPWQFLTSQHYSVDLAGDGTAMGDMYVDPISSTNPDGKIRLYVNNQLMAEVNPRYEYSSADGGYALQVESGTAYRYSGSTSATGSRHLDMPEPTKRLLPHPAQPGQPWMQFALKKSVIPLRQAGQKLLNSFSPQPAYASGCYGYLKNAFYGLAAMVIAGIEESPLGFVLAMIVVMDEMHSFARCMEQLLH
jgi:hypothetical protein